MTTKKKSPAEQIISNHLYYNNRDKIAAQLQKSNKKMGLVGLPSTSTSPTKKITKQK